MTKRCLWTLLLGAMPLLAGCTTYVYAPVTTDPVAEENIALDLFLIGDAGAPHLPDEPVLEALTRMMRRDPDRTLVVFLGDNLYPDGLPDSLDTERRPIAERVLNAQIDVMRKSRSRGVLVPGNHDWQAGGPEGWETLLRQQVHIERHGDGLAELLPRNGCPGPEVRDVGEVLRLILLDTQWWLQTQGLKPLHPDSDCPHDSPEEVVEAIQAALRDAGNRVTVVAGHHPLISGGHHGGYFDWPAYLFPPYPLARRMGWFAPQDVNSREYRIMRDALERAFAPNPPTLYAAGHEHNLQIIDWDYARFLVVSGTGIYGHTTPVRVIPTSAYAKAAAGFLRLSIRNDGWSRLAVVLVDEEGNATEDYSFWIDPPAGTAAGQ